MREKKPKQEPTHNDPAPKPLCASDGCVKVAIKYQRCMKHAHELYFARRKQRVADGTLEPLLIPVKLIVRKDDYVHGYAPEHPLAMTSGYVLEHRRVAFNHYGEGTQACKWCECPLVWKDVEVDHLDWNRGNNHIGNLVVSCHCCNMDRRQDRLDRKKGQGTIVAVGDRLKVALAKVRLD